MRVRSSSAPTVRSRPNQRALSMASAAGSTNPFSSSRSRAVKCVVVGALDGDEADERASGAEHGVDARARARGQPRAAGFEEVRLAHRRRGAHGPAQRRREAVGRKRCGHLDSVPAGGHPGAVGLVEQEDGRSVELDEVAQADHRGVEHVVEVERRRQRLGDPVQRVEQRVGVGEAAEAVEGQRLLPLGLAEDPPGVAGDHRHQEKEERPLRRPPECLVVRRGKEVGDRDGARSPESGVDGEREAPGEARGDHRGHQGEDERGLPVSGARDHDDTEGQLGEHPQTATGPSS